jgi:hypothetical protein
MAGQRQPPSDDEFGDVTEPFVPTREQVIANLKDMVCSFDEPWAGPTYTTDHGHTLCLFIGWAIQYLSEDA